MHPRDVRAALPTLPRFTALALILLGAPGLLAHPGDGRSPNGAHEHKAHDHEPHEHGAPGHDHRHEHGTHEHAGGSVRGRWVPPEVRPGAAVPPPSSLPSSLPSSAPAARPTVLPGARSPRIPPLPQVRIQGAPRGYVAVALARAGRWLALVQGRTVTVRRAEAPGPLVAVQWRVDGGRSGAGGAGKTDAGSAEGVLYVTRDGRFATPAPARLRQAIATLEADQARARCLAGKGVRVLLADGDPQSVAQRKAIGRFARRVVIRCAPGQDRACKGHKLPRWLWPRGAHSGLLSRTAIAERWGCR